MYVWPRLTSRRYFWCSLFANDITYKVWQKEKTLKRFEFFNPLPVLRRHRSTGADDAIEVARDGP